MRTGVIAKKLGMTRLFDEAGTHVPVTVLSLEGCQVTAQRTKDKDGYVALQLGAGAKKAKNTSKAERGHFAKALVEPKRHVAEFRVSEDNLIDVGAEFTADHFLAGPEGRRLGHHGRQGLRRAPSSAGTSAACAPPTASRSRTGLTAPPASARIRARCSRARRWPAIWARTLVTTLNLTVFRVDVERGLILIKGAVPGTEGTFVKIRDAVKSAAPADLPMPGAVKQTGKSAAAPAPTHRPRKLPPPPRPPRERRSMKIDVITLDGAKASARRTAGRHLRHRPKSAATSCSAA